MEFPEFAITIHRPWPWALLYLPEPLRKPIENRRWRPPDFIVGKRLAIHGGKTYDDEAEAMIRELVEQLAPRYGLDASALLRPEAMHAAGLLGSCVIPGHVYVDPETGARARSRHIAVERARSLVESHWFAGPYGWVNDSPLVLPEPVPCAGQQKIWRIRAADRARCTALMTA